MWWGTVVEQARSAKAVEPPRHVRALQARLGNVAGDQVAAPRLARAVANVVLAQMLPPGAVKGGTAMKLRLGHGRSRFTPDLDFARRATIDEFLAAYTAALAVGWGGFTGRLVPVAPAKPAGVPVDYVMQPYDIKVSYVGKSWLTVRLEVGHDELGDTDEPEWHLAEDLATVFATLGLPAPAPIAVLAVEHQVAQKLHACSTPGSERAHDLVDLQLLVTDALDLERTRDTCERLFVSRRAHAWPPEVVEGPGWVSVYAEAAVGVECVGTVDEAVRWVNGFVRSIVDAG
jgi:hypothetical protein